jgi:precorrin isomerase
MASLLSRHPIEAESYRIMASRVSLSSFEAGPRAVIERVIHASADVEYATTMRVRPSDVLAGVAAVRSGAPLVVDSEMVRAGITGASASCYLSSVVAQPGGFPTRSALAFRLAASAHPDGAIWVVGNAPTALVELLDLAADGSVRPALVIGLPVGFVGAAESKARLLASGLPAITNVGEKGGSAVAAAAFNALRRLAASS